MKSAAHADSNQESDKPTTLSYSNSDLFLKKYAFGSNDFAVIRKVRQEQQGLQDCFDSYDAYADHYAMLDKDQNPVFVMRVNQARKGPLDCEQFYPQKLLNKHKQVLCSASRFMRSKHFPANPTLANRFLHLVRADQVLDGMVGDIINAHTPMFVYYKKIGYELVVGHDFIHPRLGTESKVMLLIANGQSLTW
jgi:hypothetical protein